MRENICIVLKSLLLEPILKVVTDLPSPVLFLDHRQTTILRFIKTHVLTCRTPYDPLSTACDVFLLI